jgi:hypothetical protein
VLIVEQWGRLANVAAATQLQSTIESAARGANTRLVVFDNRRTLAPAPEVAEVMHAWALGTPRFERVAVVLASAALSVRINMEGVASRRRFRAFESVTEAVGWLTAPR